MKQIFFLCIILSLFIGCSSKDKSMGDQGTIYTCSMHPQIRQNKPGNCPICGMTLVPIPGDKSPSPANMKSMPEHKHDHGSLDKAPADAQTDIHDNMQMGSEIKIGEAREAVASVQTTIVKSNKLSKKIELFGQIQHIPDKQVDFTWYYAGRVEKVLIDFNTLHIEQGEPILKVYSEAAIADQEAYLQALQNRWLATFYERSLLTARIEAVALRLEKIGMTPDDLKAVSKNKKVQSTFILKSPISGCLVDGPLHTGERFNAETVLFRVADLSRVWFVAEVFESDLAFLKQGNEVDITVASYPDKFFKGHLVYTEPKADPQKRTIKARFTVDNPQNQLLPEVSARAKLDLTPAKEVLTIPASAVLDTGVRKLVYVAIKPGVYEQRTVTLGSTGSSNSQSETLVEVTSGLKEGEEIVSSGAFLIDAEAQLHGPVSTPQHQH